MGGKNQTVTTFEVRDHVARVSLNRPEAMNFMNPDLRWELSQHWDEVEANDDIWVAVVTGAGERVFSAGADLKHRAREREADEAQRAYELGLVNQVVPMERLDQTVEEWVSDILRCASLAVRASKQAAMCGWEHSLPQAFYTAYSAERLRQKSEDAYEGQRAFAEKRAPN